DLYDVSIVHDSGGQTRLEAFNRAGLLGPADVHTARRLARLGCETDELVTLAVALAVRAPRVGHVSVDLATVRAVAGADAAQDIDIDALPWPEPDLWLARVGASPLVATGEDPHDRPLRLIGPSLYLDRYWRDEVAVAGELLARAAAPPRRHDDTALSAILARLFGGGDQDQMSAAETAAGRLFTVIAGGPGTGKTTTVARLLAVLHLQAEALGARPPLVGLAAPTGKAAARLEEAVRAEAAALESAGALPAPVVARLSEVTGSTLHRLLGSRPGTSRFRHHRGLRLPHDVIVVDEASMISLALMAGLAEAVRPDARLVLVGDPEQLVSVEAGAVLADVVGPAAAGPLTPGRAGPAPIAGSIARLRTNRRFAGALADLAAAVQAGDEEAVLGVLRRGDDAVVWLEQEPAGAAAWLREPVSAWAGRLVDAARSGHHAGALVELGRHRVLCAHRRGPDGVAEWNGTVERWLADDRPEVAGEGAWYAGRPVLVTANDYSLRLFNGDTGVTVAGDDDSAGRVSVAFEEAGGPARLVSPSRLADVDTVYATTVHKSQGSEFERVTLLLPASTSRLLTRELLYTAVTRAKQGLLMVGTEEAVRVAVSRPIARASGLTDRLWGPAPAGPTGGRKGR
ncbi:MAG TPA: exodeoxyribonuclease V subunit alpha, partial [Acidimicrobiales bacterium]|nr:exodeoxyribonuclease V subunit alpha [Acidimicrobiales bacterium]